jgi:putative phosphoesterase
MRILILSDNHGDRDNIDRIIKLYSPLDRIFSLGDSEMKENELSDLGIVGVKGNYPFEPKFPYELKFIFEGWSMLLTHGHLYHVKMGLSKLLQKAYDEKVDIACFGHTHRTHLEESAGIILLNPGSLSNWRSHENPTFAVVEMEEKELDVKIYNVYGNIIKQLKKKR